jgi:hypothetical protein
LKKNPTQKRFKIKRVLAAQSCPHNEKKVFLGHNNITKDRNLEKLVRLKTSTKPHVHQKFEIFWTNIASTMACPKFKNGPKNGLRPLGVNHRDCIFSAKSKHFNTTYSLIAGAT